MYEAHVAMVEASPFKNLPWQFVGPTNVSGRMTDIAVVTPKGENYTIYVAGASGGVWRTRKRGRHLGTHLRPGPIHVHR